VTPLVPKPLTSGAKADGRFGKQDFVYDVGEDVYRCPAGEKLTWRYWNVEAGRKLFAEHERALALDPSNVDAAAGLGFDYQQLGRFDKSLEYLDKAILASPYDPALPHFYGGKAWANFGLKNYNQAIELARQAIAIKPNYVAYIHAILVAALALTGRDAEAHEALQRYLALPSTGSLKSIAAWKAYYSAQGGDPRFVEMNDRTYDGLRKAGMPEK
jgi:tetratricopeptide (TPR) repeat protein